MTSALHVLSVGSAEAHDHLREILLSRPSWLLVVASEVWDLSALLVRRDADVVILHDTLSSAELRSCSVYIRHHWPSAKILLIHARAEILDDPMYDERIPPGFLPERLLTTIERLASISCQKATLKTHRIVNLADKYD